MNQLVLFCFCASRCKWPAYSENRTQTFQKAMTNRSDPGHGDRGEPHLCKSFPICLCVTARLRKESLNPVLLEGVSRM